MKHQRVIHYKYVPWRSCCLNRLQNSHRHFSKFLITYICVSFCDIYHNCNTVCLRITENGLKQPKSVRQIFKRATKFKHTALYETRVTVTLLTTIAFTSVHFWALSQFRVRIASLSSCTKYLATNAMALSLLKPWIKKHDSEPVNKTETNNWTHCMKA